MGIILILIILIFGFWSGPEAVSTSSPATVEVVEAGGHCFDQDLGYDLSEAGIGMGTIVPRSQADEWSSALPADVEYFEPSLDEIAALEKALLAEEPTVDTYSMLYIGYSDEDGNSFILVDGSRGDAGDAAAADEDGCVEVEPVSIAIDDGGDSLFEATYSVEDDEIEEFSFHGDA